MVNFAFPTLAVLALTSAVGAVAVPETSAGASSEGEVERFSFVKWVDDIIANPKGTHLSPEQAYEAWQATVVNATEPAGTLHKRVRCNNIEGGSAPAPDAVRCINHLAALGTKPCKVTVKSRFATFGNAEIWGVGAGSKTHSSELTFLCSEHIARAAGKVMDVCWRADNTVQGDEMAWGNGNIDVHIVRKGIIR
ncbi:hypothetical protein C8A00DRAFT_19683 [Chaetomidium leptoderma]|uniref:Ecp2 effector protein domain-containing protein n=1 Tax=Chaetomidium leptoderma TaxID=669021 RepID=A0AAN6VBP7_9PEZI|nr:hypothetical protein C8A00DRAFT_19683 [Chaetomidium leptoderma]